MASLFVAFWPMVLSIGVERKDNFVIKRSMLKGVLDPNDKGKTLAFVMFKPYVSVFKMHFLLFLLLMLSFIGVHTSFFVFTAIMALYFFPFGVLIPDEVKEKVKADLEEKLKAA